MKNILPRLVVLLACLLVAASGLAAESRPAEVQDSVSSVEVADGLLTVRLENASLGEVARQLADEAGVVFYFEDESLRQSRVDATFRNRPLAEGVQEIAENLNTILVYDRERRLRAVHVLPRAAPGPGAPVSPAAPRGGAASPYPGEGLMGGPSAPQVPGVDQSARLPGMPPGTQVETRPEAPESAPPDAGQAVPSQGEEPVPPPVEAPPLGPVPETSPDQTLPPPGREAGGGAPPPALRNLREPGAGQ